MDGSICLFPQKNETEKEYFKLQEAHEGQQALLQELQIKVQKRKAIQDTCKKQEKVIVQLERLLAQQRQGHFNGVAETSDTYRFLSDENTKLQSEVSQYKEMLRQVEAKQKLPRSPDKHITSEGPMSDLERLELYEKLERAEGRIVALEKQVKPGDIKENFKMDDGNDDSVLFGNIARSRSARAVDYRYKS
ncbi:PREDICTED: uncharacterized protein LOC107330721 [Acropora digitifera]|uniref:uncharacterized protein LOC107330721 n=1 Tax=Acropora digitifera TaxID=70779 RepID=UPI00077AE72D|nr:PREDICTED: uncharacterized protein LOC107330721 [Acropora digitifera]